MRNKHYPLNAPFVEAYHKGGHQRPTAIIIRSSDTSSDEGVALEIAKAHHRANSPQDTSHYIIDSGATYQCVPDRIVAGPKFKYAEPNAIKILMCSEWADSLEQWSDTTHAKVLERTVDLVARLVLVHKINLRYLDADAFHKWSKRRRRSRGGLIVNVNGAWPLTTFMNELEMKVSNLKKSN